MDQIKIGKFMRNSLMKYASLMMALILPWKTFVFLTCVALALFIRYEKKLWLRALNILVLGAWVLFSILVALTA